MTLTIDGIDLAIKQLERYRDSLDSKLHELIERLGERGVQVAAAEFAGARYDGTNDVIVSGEWTSDNVYQVNADGNPVAFIEFGSGVTYKGEHPLKDNVPGISPIGTYGQGKGSRKAWGYYGDPGTNGKVVKEGVVITRGNPPARAMYKADVEMRTVVEEIAKEVFK